MNKKALQMYVDRNEIPITLDNYKTLTEIRTAIKDYEEDPEGFVKREEKLEVEREENRTLDKLNPLD